MTSGALVPRFGARRILLTSGAVQAVALLGTAAAGSGVFTTTQLGALALGVAVFAAISGSASGGTPDADR